MAYPRNARNTPKNRSKLSLPDSLRVFNRSKSSLAHAEYRDGLFDYEDRYHDHAGLYRWINDLNTPFVPSPPRHPPRELPPLDEGQVRRLLSGDPEPRSSVFVRAGRKISKLSKNVLKGRNQPRAVAHAEYLARNHHHRVARRPSPLPLREWKAYGYYARPCVNGVWVDNTTTGKPPPPSNADLAAIFDSLVEQGVDHPERWIAGLRHPSLPPRPPGWDTPDLTKPQPFPFELSVNPLFYSHPACIRWNMTYPPPAISYTEVPDITYASGVTALRHLPLNPSDLAQPATHPRIPYMQVTVVAQHSPIFPWPFWVKNKHGITVGDVVGQIYANFREFVGKGEFDRWEPWRKHESCTACLLRYCEAKNWYMAEEEDNQLMRIDYLCGHIMFDGMKPHPNGEGWVISVRPRTVAEIHADTTYYNQRLPPGLSISPMGQFTAEIAARGDLPPA
ncbi:hypothetical protein EV714DRAFT_197855 [Schizophyllum commune]